MTTARTELGRQARVVLTFSCPKCQRTNRQELAGGVAVSCGCGWERAAAPGDFLESKPARCLVCSCDDLWRQKNFSARLGLFMVGTAILLSTIAYAFWQPMLALGILMAFALVDALLYLIMRDVSVCYRCGARHSGFAPADTHENFDLEVAERYRQERLRRRALSQLFS